MRSGTRRLLLLTTSLSLATVRKALDRDAQLAIGRTERTVAELVDDCVVAVADAIVVANGVAWDPESFAALVAVARAELTARSASAMAAVGRIMVVATTAEEQLRRLIAPALGPAVKDMRTQLLRLMRPGFVTASGVKRLPDIERYLRGVQRRAETVGGDIGRDRAKMDVVHALEARYAGVLKRLARSALTDEVVEVGWMLEELRIGQFAQVIGTSGSISDRRIAKALDRIERGA